MDQQFDADALLPERDAQEGPSASDIDTDDANPGDWFALARKIFGDPVVGPDVRGPKPADAARPAWTPFAAWCFIISKANFRRAPVRDGDGREYLLEAGQLLASRSYLARRFNWSEKAVRLWIAKLVNAGKLAVLKGPAPPQFQGQGVRAKKGQGSNVLTVCKYGKYQKVPQAKGPGVKIQKGQPPPQKGARNRNTTNTSSLTLRDGRGSEVDVREVQQRAPIAKPSAENQLQLWQNPEGLAFLERTQAGAVARMVRDAVHANRGEWPSWRLGAAPGMGEDNAFFAYLSADELARWTPREPEPADVDDLPENVIRFAPRPRRELGGAIA